MIGRWHVLMLAAAGMLMVTMLAALMCLAIVIAVTARGDDAIQRWFQTLQRPDMPYRSSCCGEADAYWADIVETGPNGELVAVVTDDRPDAPLRRKHVPVGTKVVVPPQRIAWKQGNPTGHIVVFLTPSLEVLCYVQNGGV